MVSPWTRPTTRRRIRTYPTHHRESTACPNTMREYRALDEWISSKKKLVIHDTLRPEHLSDLYVTLPTRDGSHRPVRYPEEGDRLQPGHHLVFFHPRNPESVLRVDGTDADFCPPEPFTRRMWAGGVMKWKKPLTLGTKVTSTSVIDSVEKKGFGKGKPNDDHSKPSHRSPLHNLHTSSTSRVSLPG